MTSNWTPVPRWIQLPGDPPALRRELAERRALSDPVKPYMPLPTPTEGDRS